MNERFIVQCANAVAALVVIVMSMAAVVITPCHNNNILHILTHSHQITVYMKVDLNDPPFLRSSLSSFSTSPPAFLNRVLPTSPARSKFIRLGTLSAIK